MPLKFCGKSRRLSRRRRYRPTTRRCRHDGSPAGRSREKDDRAPLPVHRGIFDDRRAFGDALHPQATKVDARKLGVEIAAGRGHHGHVRGADRRPVLIGVGEGGNLTRLHSADPRGKALEGRSVPDANSQTDINNYPSELTDWHVLFHGASQGSEVAASASSTRRVCSIKRSS